jgi:hypothetical protein
MEGIGTLEVGNFFLTARSQAGQPKPRFLLVRIASQDPAQKTPRSGQVSRLDRRVCFIPPLGDL